MKFDKNKRRQKGGTVKASGAVPRAGKPVSVGAFQNHQADHSKVEKLRLQAASNRCIAARYAAEGYAAEGYAAEGNAEEAAFWRRQALACVEALLS